MDMLQAGKRIWRGSVPKKLRKAVLPVAGLGTRFLPATKVLAKEMLPVVDKPLIQYAVEEARAAGIEQFCFVTGRGKTSLVDHFDIQVAVPDDAHRLPPRPRKRIFYSHGGTGTPVRYTRQGRERGADGRHGRWNVGGTR